MFVKNLKDVWGLPGGRIIKGETPEQALARELKEELGFSNVKISRAIHNFSFVSDIARIEYEVTIYECSTDEKVILQTEEAKECRWVKLDQINTLNMRSGYKHALQSYFSVY